MASYHSKHSFRRVHTFQNTEVQILSVLKSVFVYAQVMTHMNSDSASFALRSIRLFGCLS